jgi:UTP-glucose-1-phosphate uridylyltransferase
MIVTALLKPIITYAASSVIKAGINKLVNSKKNKSTIADKVEIESKLKNINLRDRNPLVSKLVLSFIFEKAVYYLVKWSIKLLACIASKTKTKVDDAFVKAIEKEIYVIFDEKFKQK